jgi:hypothetical protein
VSGQRHNAQGGVTKKKARYVRQRIQRALMMVTWLGGAALWGWRASGDYGRGERFHWEYHGIHLYEQVQRRHGPFYVAIKPLLAEDEEYRGSVSIAQPPSPIQFEDIPLDEARNMSRAPRMDLQLYNALKAKIQALGNTAARMTIPEGTNPNTMRYRILRVATELNVQVTIRKVTGSLLFWRSTADDIQQVKEMAQHLCPAQRNYQTTRPGRRQRT